MFGMTPKLIFQIASKKSLGLKERPSRRMRSRSTSLDAIRTKATLAEAKAPSGATASPTSTVSSSSPEVPPLLLLEYSDFYVSSEGVTRTLYHHVDDGMSVEEIYNLTKASKTYIVRHRGQGTTSSSSACVATVPTTDLAGLVASCPHLATLSIQEIDHGIDSFGTGAVTWEASIAASLHLNSTAGDAVTLRGDVLELGCGVGVGGILNVFWPWVLSKTNGNHCHTIHSLTLTDGQDEVLRHCQLNVNHALASVAHHDPSFNFPSIHVSKLDWNEHGSSTPERETSTKKYHTVMACDCTYRIEDVAPLCRTAVSLLHSDASSRIHLFSPHNRGSVCEVIRYMREELGLCLTVQLFTAERCRLAPCHTHRMTFHDGGTNEWNQLELDQCVVVASTNAVFVHIVASRAISMDESGDDTISDID